MGPSSDVNEVYLFHGTNPESADLIAKGDFSLDRAGSAVGTMFGPGVYLAENASKSDEYAKEGSGVSRKTACGVRLYLRRVAPPTSKLSYALPSEFGLCYAWSERKSNFRL